VATSYKVKAGYHSEDKSVYRKGEIFVSDKPLHKMFPNKFDIVGTDVEAPKKKKDGGKKARYGKVETLRELGKDVSQKFPDAINQGLRVYQNEDGEYFVTEERDLFTPLNDKPLTRVRTKKFLLNR
jgi:hypothetical protein